MGADALSQVRHSSNVRNHNNCTWMFEIEIGRINNLYFRQERIIASIIKSRNSHEFPEIYIGNNQSRPNKGPTEQLAQ